MVNSIFNGWRMEDVWLDKLEVPADLTGGYMRTCGHTQDMQRGRPTSGRIVDVVDQVDLFPAAP